MVDVTIARENPDQPDVIALLCASDSYHGALYPAESNHLVDVESLAAPNVRFLVARNGHGAAIGCGALVLCEDDGLRTGELKRMWVAPSARGSRLGQRILVALESEARDAGARVVRLETGIHQPEAIGLYRSAGYTEREPFGAYAPDPLSLFMEKTLAGPLAGQCPGMN